MEDRNLYFIIKKFIVIYAVIASVGLLSVMEGMLIILNSINNNVSVVFYFIPLFIVTALIGLPAVFVLKDDSIFIDNKNKGTRLFDEDIWGYNTFDDPFDLASSVSTTADVKNIKYEEVLSTQHQQPTNTTPQDNVNVNDNAVTEKPVAVKKTRRKKNNNTNE